MAIALIRKRPKAPLIEKQETETISSLIIRCNNAVHRMGNGNPHKALIHDCALALRQLCDQMYELEKKIEDLMPKVVS